MRNISRKCVQKFARTRKVAINQKKNEKTFYLFLLYSFYIGEQRLPETKLPTQMRNSNPPFATLSASEVYKNHSIFRKKSKSNGLDFISKRSRNDEFLNQSQSFMDVPYRRLYQYSPYPFAVAGADGIITNINRKIEIALGYYKHQVVGSSMLQLVDPSSIPAMMR